MRYLSWIMMSVIAIIALLIVGIVAGRVGGIAIRRQGVTQLPLTIQVSEPVVRGVPVLVRWDTASSEMPVTLTFDWRDQESEYRLGVATGPSGQTTLQFPCETDDQPGALVVRSGEDGKVVGNQSVALAVAGPECVQ